MNKIFAVLIGIVVVAAVVIGWQWMLHSDEWSQSSPTPTPTSSPAAQSDSDLNLDLNELDNIDANIDIDAEFQQIDQDINNL